MVDTSQPAPTMLISLMAASVLVALALTGCSTESAEADEPRGRSSSTQPPASTTAPSSTSPTVDSAVEEFVDRCAGLVSLKLQIGDGGYVAAWGSLDADGIDGECRRIVTMDSATAAAMDAEIVQLQQYFDALAAAETTTTTAVPPPPPPPPPRPTGPPPSIRIDCGLPGNGDYEWMHVTYGYNIDYYDPIVEWGMDYGDGNSYTVDDEGEARRDLYWHKYYSPGTYQTRAWVVDSFGRRDEDVCTFTWSSYAGGSRTDWQPSYHDYDLDCADIGEEVWVGDDDPDGLDGDGDGYGCEGW